MSVQFLSLIHICLKALDTCRRKPPTISDMAADTAMVMISVMVTAYTSGIVNT